MNAKNTHHILLEMTVVNNGQEVPITKDMIKNALHRLTQGHQLLGSLQDSPKLTAA